MKKVLVTGSTGFIGNLLIKELLKRGYQVIATSSSIETAKRFDWFKDVVYKELNFIELNSSTNYYTFFERPESLIHLAWEGLPNYKSSFHVIDNLPRHLRFLNNMLQNGLKDLTVAGTCLEYGMLEGCLYENMDVDPIVPYAIAKNELRIELEKLCKQYQVNFKWVRLFYMYGRGQNSSSLFAQLDKAIQNKEFVFNMSGGEQERDFLPIDKMVDLFLAIAMQNEVEGVINCCSGKPIKVKRFVENILLERFSTLRLNLGFYPYADYEPMSFWGDNNKLKKITQYD
jgi:nucleoside-diphosphate-sugar epimerase